MESEQYTWRKRCFEKEKEMKDSSMKLHQRKIYVKKYQKNKIQTMKPILFTSKRFRGLKKLSSIVNMTSANLLFIIETNSKKYIR